MVGQELVYGSGIVWAAVLIAFAFFFVAYTDGFWFVGTGLVVAAVAGLTMFTGWRGLADYPLVYRDGDRPKDFVSGLSTYDSWDLGPGVAFSTAFTVDGADEVESLAGRMRLDYGCPEARVDWRINLAGELLVSGTLREGDKRELEDVAVRLPQQPVVVRMTAARTDPAGCTTALLWENPGFEGPGHGKFRFILPLPDAE